MSAFQAGRLGAVGKVPTRAEYLPVPAHAPSFAAFDAWLTQATEWAASRAGPSWPETFARGAIQGFVFREAGAAPASVLCGAVGPSRDSAGRQFPLALAAPLQLAPDLLARPELLPFSLEGVWGVAAEALLELQASTSQGPALDQDIEVTADSDPGSAADLYADWATQLPLHELWALLGPPLAEPQATLRLLFETLAPIRGVERPSATGLSLRLPLGLAGGATLCFWLDLVRRWAGWGSTVPSLFWSHDGHDGVALVHLGRPPKETLAELWMPRGECEQIADLTTVPSPALVELLPPLPAPVHALLGSPDASVAHLLEAVTS